MKKWYPVLLAEGAALAAAAFFAPDGSSAVMALAAAPWQQLGAGLRALSLTGWGDGLAWGLYLLACLVPAGAALWLRRCKKAQPADWLLALLSAVLAPVLYGMVNPGWLAGWFTAPVPQQMALALAGWAVWGLLAAWAMCRALAALTAAPAEGLYPWLKALLAGIDLLFVAAVFGTGLAGLLADLDALAAANTAVSAGRLLPTRAVLWLGWLVGSLPALLGLGVVHRGFALLAAARADRYSPATVAAARALADLCAAVVTISLLAQALYGLLQLALAGVLYDIDLHLTLDLGGLGVALTALLIAHWLAEGSALKEENDGFI